METKTYFIRRKNTSLKIPDFIHNESSKKLSSEWVRSGDVLRGLTFEEEARYMPMIVGVSSSSPNFNEACKDYWKDFSVQIPPGEGLEVKISYHNGKLVETVDNITNYIILSYAQKSSKCANDKQSLFANRAAIFFIYDPELETIKEKESADIHAKAMKVYLTVYEDQNKVDQILSLMDYVPEDLSPAQKAPILLSKFNSNPGQFMSIAKDPNLEIKYFISNLVRYSIVTIEGSDYIDGNKNYGSLDRFVQFLKSPENSPTLMSYNTKLNNIRKTNSAMPEVNPVAMDDVNISTTNPFAGNGSGSVSVDATKKVEEPETEQLENVEAKPSPDKKPNTQSSTKK